MHRGKSRVLVSEQSALKQGQMGALNSIPLCSKASTRSNPVLELDDDEQKVPDANNNSVSAVVSQPLGTADPEATSTPTESSSSQSETDSETLKDFSPPSLDTVLPEEEEEPNTTNDSGLDDLETASSSSIPSPPSDDEDDEEGSKKRDDSLSGDSEHERPLSPIPPLEKDKAFSNNILDDFISGSNDATSTIEPLR